MKTPAPGYLRPRNQKRERPGGLRRQSCHVASPTTTEAGSVSKPNRQYRRFTAAEIGARCDDAGDDHRQNAPASHPARCLIIPTGSDNIVARLT
jgi:hypothetical protein